MSPAVWPHVIIKQVKLLVYATNFIPVEFFPKENGNKDIRHKAITGGMITWQNCQETHKKHHLKIQKNNKKIIERIDKSSKY